MSGTTTNVPSNPHPSDPSRHSESSSMIRRVLPKGRTPHVCVVGAGMAGMRCAQILSDKGMKVTVFEGRDRIGGRMHQSNHLGHWVDLGPNWIHGTDHNPFVDLAKETGTTTFSAPELSAVFDEFGYPMPESKATQYLEVVWGMISDAFKYSKEHSASIPPTRSLRDYVEEQVRDKGLTTAQQRIVLQVAEMWGAFIGDPIERQSLKFFWLEECIDGENLFVASTYKSILSHIGATALAEATVHLSTKVTSIESRPSSTTNANSEVIVTTSTGSTHNFDHVVMTAPLGYLKRNLSTFVPPLPDRITTAITNISYGRLEKVYITFPSAFWDLPTSSPSISTSTPSSSSSPSISTLTPSSSSSPTISTLTPSSSSSPSPSSPTPASQYPFFTHFLTPTYAPSNPHNWNIEAVSLSALPGPTAHPTLLFYLHGPCASHLTSLLSALPPSSPLYASRLTHFFRPYYSRLPHYDPHRPACTPTAFLATDWQADEFAGWGSYSNFQVADPGGEGADLAGDVQALRHGMPERRVWFAGEHVAPFVALGTVTGAWWSGEVVGGRIAGTYGKAGGEGVGKGDEGAEGVHGEGNVMVGASDGEMDGDGDGDGARRNGMAL